MVAAVLCMALVKRESFRKGLYGLLALAVMVNMVSEGNACFVERVSLKKGDPEYFGELYSRDIQQALNYVRATDQSSAVWKSLRGSDSLHGFSRSGVPGNQYL